MSSDKLIDTFVRLINRSPHRRIREEDVPPDMRVGSAEFGIYYDWTIRRRDPIGWIDILEDQLPAPLPPSYRSLVARYLFPAFDVAPITLHANTGQALYHEMTTVMVGDLVLSDVLLKNGFAQFARPSDGHSDPICFDFRQKRKDGECPIVRISHHAIVAGNAIQPVEEIAPSFYEFVERYLATAITPFHRAASSLI